MQLSQTHMSAKILGNAEGIIPYQPAKERKCLCVSPSFQGPQYASVVKKKEMDPMPRLSWYETMLFLKGYRIFYVGQASNETSSHRHG